MSTHTESSTPPEAHTRDWGISSSRIKAATRLIAQAVNPLRIIAFGSWARGEHRPESDWDVAVILDSQSDKQAARELYSALQGIAMSMDILTIDWERHLRFKGSINSVHYDIDKEGIILYERTLDGSASRVAAT